MFRTQTHPGPTDDREAYRRAQRARAAASLTEFDRETLARGPFGTITHEGDTYRIVRGEVVDARYSSAVAFYRTEDGADVVFLERLP
jgi:hypothetical protein